MKNRRLTAASPARASRAVERIIVVIVIAGWFATAGSRSGRASELAALAVEIGRTAVVMHHHAINPRCVSPQQVTINHQGDVCHFEAVMVWSSGPFGGQIGCTPRRAIVYGSLVNRSDLRRLFDLEYVEAPDRPWIGCDNAPKVVTYWNTRFARQDTLALGRELGQPLHRSLHPQPACYPGEAPCPSPIFDPQPFDPGLPAANGEQVFEGAALERLLGGDKEIQRVSGEEPAKDNRGWFRLPPIRTGRRPVTASFSEVPATPSLRSFSVLDVSK